jgi:hypothetical protein
VGEGEGGAWEQGGGNETTASRTNADREPWATRQRMQVGETFNTSARGGGGRATLHDKNPQRKGHCTQAPEEALERTSLPRRHRSISWLDSSGSTSAPPSTVNSVTLRSDGASRPKADALPCVAMQNSSSGRYGGGKGVLFLALGCMGRVCKPPPPPSAPTHGRTGARTTKPYVGSYRDGLS